MFFSGLGEVGEPSLDLVAELSLSFGWSVDQRAPTPVLLRSARVADRQQPGTKRQQDDKLPEGHSELLPWMVKRIAMVPSCAWLAVPRVFPGQTERCGLCGHGCLQADAPAGPAT